MPEFTYIALDSEGRRTRGTISAASRREAVAALSSRSLFPLDVQGGAAPEASGTGRGVSAQVMAATYGQLSDLLRSGVPLLRALDVVRQQTSHVRLKEVLGEVHRRVEEGSSLADAMARFPRVFGEMAISMVRAGGEGGFLEEALARVAQFTEAQDDLKKRVLGAMAYPMVLAGLGALVIVGLMIFLVPRFETLFANLRQRGELPALTDALLGFSRLLQQWGLWALPLVVLAGWFLRQWLRSDQGRWWWDRLKLQLPIVGRIFLHFAVARFCRVLGTLLHNGVPILRSLEISSDAAGNRVLAEAIQKATENISAGQSLAAPLAASGRFPAAVVEMISVAEQANTLETVLLGIADSLERRTWRQLDLAVRLLEPLLLMMLAGVVLLVVIALLLPVLKLSTTI